MFYICVHRFIINVYIYLPINTWVHSAHPPFLDRLPPVSFEVMYNVTACSMTKWNDQLIFINLVKLFNAGLERIESGFVILH
jgi:hypothetical protein